MRMNPVAVLLILSVTLTGCAHKPPSCDGSNRRPLNAPKQAGVSYESCGQVATLERLQRGEG